MKKILYLIVILILSINLYAKNMAECNPGIEEKLLMGIRAWHNKSYFGDVKKYPFSLFYFSDIHGDEYILGRYCEFLSLYGKYFDDALSCGDMVEYSLISPFDYWAKTPGAEKILMAIGNHDAINSHEVWDWTNLASQNELYTKFFEPYILNWNVVCEKGKTYYFKDYDKKNIRLIVINYMLTGKEAKEQIKWFRETLTGAKEKSYSVVAVSHCPAISPEKFKKIDCNFSAIDFSFKGDSSMKPYQKEIQNFMDEKGDFVCWLSGHIHYDMISVDRDFPKQLNVSIGASVREMSNNDADMERYTGRNQDLADAVIVDTVSKTLKIIRIGANSDIYLRNKNELVINYKNQKIITEN